MLRSLGGWLGSCPQGFRAARLQGSKVSDEGFLQRWAAGSPHVSLESESLILNPEPEDLIEPL